MSEKDDYIWCPKSAVPKGRATGNNKDALKLIKKNPRACEKNCPNRYKCTPFKNYWQYDLFEFLNKKTGS